MLTVGQQGGAVVGTGSVHVLPSLWVHRLPVRVCGRLSLYVGPA